MIGSLKRRIDYVDRCMVASNLLVDTGRAHDLVQQSDTTPHQNGLFRDRAVVCNTANGGAASTMRLKVTIPEIDCEASVWFLCDTPPVLTIGGRSDLGYACVWPAGATP